MARNTPSAAVNTVKPATTYHGWCTPSISSRAPKAVPIAAPVEEPAAVAVDCMQLFSSMVIWLNRPPQIERMAFQITKDSTHAVIATPERPAQFERRVEIGDGHEHAQHAAH